MKEISLPFRLSITLTQTDVHWVEAQLLEQRTKLFLDALQQVLAHIEGEVIPRAACAGCGGPLVHNGRVPLVLETLLGRVTYARQRLRGRGCGADVYPLDAALGLVVGSGSTLGVRERALWAAVEVSYAKAGAFLAKFAGLAVSHGSIHRWAQEEGRLLDKRMYASFEEAETFGERFWVRCAAAGAATGGQIVFVSDGAPWIHTLQRAYFPGALVVLDPWPLTRQIQWAWGADSGGLVGRCLADAWRGDVRGLRRRLRARLGHERDAARRTRGEDLLGYVDANAEGIANLARLEATGSGAAEKTVDALVVHRYKKRGMSWSRVGSSALLRLRLLKANGEWDRYWSSRLEAHARRVA